MTGSKAQEQQLPAAWQAAKGMIHAAESDAKRSRDDLATLLEKSSNVYFPGLGDPFDADFTTHRWLRGAREEVYSDWLAWIIERQASGEDILSLFGIETELKPAGPISVQRELAVGDGRLDLCIRFGTRGTLVVEVKTRSVPDAEQLARYLSWVKGQPGNLGVVLLVPNRLDEELPEGVALCSWWDVAERFRDWSSRWLAAGRGIEAALALSFCGAVEQNILGLGTTGLEIVKTLDYIEGWMKETKMPVKRESTLILRSGTAP